MSCHTTIFLYSLLGGGEATYVNAILPRIDPHNHIKQGLFRDSCDVQDDGSYWKDLRKVSDDLSQLVMVDDNPDIIVQEESLLEVKCFFDDMQDNKLEHLARFLVSIKDAPDVREVCKTWKEGQRSQTDDNDEGKKEEPAVVV